jgi:leader peptidase (prepilin peptidase)/N-methyltransferase
MPPSDRASSGGMQARPAAPMLLILAWPLAGMLAGLIVGSFCATLVIRWPAGRTMGGRSQCDACGRQLSPAELVPLLGWAAGGGRCRTCAARIDRRQPLIEIGCALVGALALAAEPAPAGFAGALLGWALLVLAWLDAEHYWLPDRITWPLAAAGLLLGHGALPDRLIGLAAGGIAPWLLALAFRRLRGHDGLGLGDVKLMAGLGAWLGWQWLPHLLFAAAGAGLLLAALLHCRKAEPGGVGELPFGTCLALAAFPLWLWSA